MTFSLAAGGPGGDGRGWLLNLVPAAPAAGLFVAVVGFEPIASPVRISLWGLAAMFFVAEVAVVHVEVRRTAHSFSMSELPVVLGLFFAAPWALVLGHLVGGLLALTLRQRQSPLKLSFSLAQFCLGSSLATIVFSAIGATDPFFARGWVATFAAILAGHTVTLVSTIAARSLNEGELQLKGLRAAVGLGTVPVLATAGLALAAANLVWIQSSSAWLLLVPVAALALGSHAYTAIRARYQGLEFLYETTREVQGATNTEEALETLLRRAAAVFRAERAEMVFFPVSPGAPAFRTSLAEDKVDAILPVSLEPAACERAVASFQGARLVAAAEEPELSSLFTAGIDHALVAPLVTAAKTNGVFLVGNGRKEVAGFDSDDLELFEALADHASVLLEKRSLQQSLYRLTEEIEDRERTEQLLREAQAKYRSLVEDVPAIVYISPLRDDLPWSYVSPQIAPVLGYSPQAWLAGPTWRDRIHPEDRERVLRDRASSAGEARRDAFVGEYRLLAKDGAVVWVSDEATIVRREDQPLFYRGVLLDVTRRKQAEADKHALELQLRHAQKMEAIGELAGGVAHDFNNLLAVIRNYAQFVDEELDQDDPTKEDLAEILKASERATSLVRQLLTFSRKEIIRPELIDLNQIVGELQTLLKRALRESITTVVRLEEGLAAVEMDPGQVHQLLLNLAVNAQDAMPDGGTLVFETSTEHVEPRDASHFDGLEPGPHACITVSDTGIGMSAEVKSRIFEPFFTTKGRTSGTGLGLSTVYGAIKRAGGDIAVYSREGLGTTFKIYLPARAQDAIPAPSHHRAEKRDGGRPEATILVAEDEPGVRNVVERVLSQNGYRVLAADSVNAALAAARAEPGPLHLLLTDVVMVGRSGRELAEEMAKLRPGIACLYMSGYPDEEVGRHGVLGSGEELLQKPFSAAELLAAVESCLDREGSSRP